MTEKTENDTVNQADFIQEADETNGIQIVNGVDAARLLSYIERVERLEEKKKALSNDIKKVFEEAKRNKIDVSAMRKILQMRKMDEHDRQELDFIVEQYKIALGMNDGKKKNCRREA